MASSIPVAQSRPWTPPDTDSAYFSETFRSSSAASDDDRGSDLSHPVTPSRSAASSKRPKPTSSPTEPYYLPKNSQQGDTYAREIRSQDAADLDLGALITPHSLSYARPHYDLSRHSAPSLHFPLEAFGNSRAHAHNSDHPYSNLDYPPTPHTPVKASYASDHHTSDGMPRYPYTPDSSQIIRKRTPPPASPLPRMPWDDDASSSPVQNALSSCLVHLEGLIGTRRPNEDQMEYLMSRLEDMASFLSAPEAQSRQSDDHLFSDVDAPLYPSGLGITSSGTADDSHEAIDAHVSEEYISEVEKFIEGVKKYTEDLKMRMDEVKQLNSIQLDIITDLRRELKKEGPLAETKELNMPKLGSGESKESTEKSKRYHQSKGFWGAIGEALDVVGDMLYEW